MRCQHSAMNTIPLPNNMAENNSAHPERARDLNIIEISDDSDDDFHIPGDFPSDLEDFDEDQGHRQGSGNILGNISDRPQQPNEMAAQQGMSSTIGQPQPSIPALKMNWVGDYILDDAWDDPDLATAMIQEITGQQTQMQPNSRSEPQDFQPPDGAEIRSINGPAVVNVDAPPLVESRTDVVAMVLVVFPDICQDHIAELYSTVSQTSVTLIAHILDQTENGKAYPKAKDKEKTLKRKRDADENDSAAAKYGALDRAPLSATSLARRETKKILSAEFGYIAMCFIETVLEDSGQHLFNAYRVLEEAERTYDLDNGLYLRLKHRRAKHAMYEPHNIQQAIDKASTSPEIKEVYLELQAARKAKADGDAIRAAEHQKQLDEEENERKAQAEGTMSECGCCFGDYPMNRMVHCNADTLHWFCRGCSRKTAETEIGNSKYTLHCMSMDACTGGFSNDQRSKFLDAKTTVALERNEQEAMLRMAGIENLASCPFCPYAAEYPPVEVDKEFRCQAPDCEKVSCRLCKFESHIPKSCEEFAKENGLSIRRQIEEAMTAALIRKCNKCRTPFVKEEGCNKMTCTRNGCLNVQCYVCSKSCSYDHFNDSSRGGKPGNCPLFESVEERHTKEIAKAEKDALAKVRAEHPEYTDEDLKIKVSKAVLKDENDRKARDPRANPRAMVGRRLPELVRVNDIVRANAQREIQIPGFVLNPARYSPIPLPHAAEGGLGWQMAPLEQDHDFLAYRDEYFVNFPLAEDELLDDWFGPEEAPINPGQDVELNDRRPSFLPPPPPPPPPRAYKCRGNPFNEQFVQVLEDPSAMFHPDRLALRGNPQLDRAKLRVDFAGGEAPRKTQTVRDQRHSLDLDATFRAFAPLFPNLAGPSLAARAKKSVPDEGPTAIGLKSHTPALIGDTRGSVVANNRSQGAPSIYNSPIRARRHVKTPAVDPNFVSAMDWFDKNVGNKAKPRPWLPRPSAGFDVGDGGVNKDRSVPQVMGPVHAPVHAPVHRVDGGNVGSGSVIGGGYFQGGFDLGARVPEPQGGIINRQNSGGLNGERPLTWMELAASLDDDDGNDEDDNDDLYHYDDY